MLPCSARCLTSSAVSQESCVGEICSVCQEPLRKASLVSSGMESATRLISRTRSCSGVCLLYFSLNCLKLSSTARSQAGSHVIVIGG